MDIGKSPSLRLPGATAWRMNWSVPDQTQKRYKDSHGFSLA